MKIGIVDVDTSHPQSWIPIERELGHEIAGLWDGGAIHPASYVQEFAQTHSIPRIYDNLQDMAADVDCAIIHGCDWDTHIEKARPFVEAGKSILIDKPMAGKLADIEQIKQWVKQGARITGGSSVRFCYENQEWLSQPVEERGTPDTILCGCGVDDFNYGIHAYAMLAGLMGAGAVSARHLGKGVQRRIQVNWPDGRLGIVIVGQAAQWLPFYTSITTQKGATQYVANAANLYRALLEKALPYLAGETDTPPAQIDDLVEPELWAIAARQSMLNGNSEVKLSEIKDDEGYDGAAFAVEYRAMRYPENK